MKTWLLVCIAVAVFCSGAAYAYTQPYTLTFDDIPTGQDLSHYLEQYGFGMALGWEVVDHSGSTWGPPRSGTNVLIWNGNPDFGAAFGFGVDGVSEYTVRLVGGYFSTEPGIVLSMTGYGRDAVAVATALIGDPADSWTNCYVEIFSETEEIAFVHISGINSQEDRYHFCLDDLTIVPVPEPSSLLALAGGLGALGVLLRRRRT